MYAVDVLRLMRKKSWYVLECVVCLFSVFRPHKISYIAACDYVGYYWPLYQFRCRILYASFSHSRIKARMHFATGWHNRL